MPKQNNKGFGITAKEACENTKKLGQEFERINKMKEADAKTKELLTAADYSESEAKARAAEDEKAEPQDESETICYYYTGQEPHGCPGPMGDEAHYVIKGGKMVMAHKRCHKRAMDGIKVTPNVMIR